MSKLILTKDEKLAEKYIQWSDEALGKLVKHLAIGLLNRAREEEQLATVVCAQMLCCIAAEANADDMKIALEGVTEGDKELGDWTVFIGRKKC